MFEDVSFDTTENKVKWGGIAAGVCGSLVLFGVMIGCYCKGRIYRKKENRTKGAYGSSNVIEGAVASPASAVLNPSVKILASAPPYEGDSNL